MEGTTGMSDAKSKSMKDTGERMIPAYHKGKLVYGEHIVRYEAVLPIVKNKTVLDIASGSGYGTEIIATQAKKVFGVDVDKEAVKYATLNFGRKNIDFLLGDGKDIPLEDGTVDVVTSFETLEHIEDYNHFMAEVKRVLKPDGLLVLSTPNDVEFPEGAHFHLHEFEKKELESLVSKYFTNAKPYFQATWIYNAILTESQMSTEVLVDIPTRNLAPVNTDKALYFFMLCSNRKISEEVLPLSAISEHWSTRKALEHNQEMDAYIRKTIKHFQKILAAKEDQIEKLIAAASEPKPNEDKKSKVWKFIKKVSK